MFTVGHVGTTKPTGGDGGQELETDGPEAETLTPYEPPIVKSRGPVDPFEVFSHAPSPVPSVVVGTPVVFVKGVPDGVVTVQFTDEPGARPITPAEILTLAVLPAPTQPVTVAVGAGIDGHGMHPARVIIPVRLWSGQFGDFIVTVAPVVVVAVGYL